MARRLTLSTSWDPDRIHGFAAAAHTAILQLEGGHVLDDMISPTVARGPVVVFANGLVFERSDVLSRSAS